MLPKPPEGYLESGRAEARILDFINAGDFDMPAPLPKRADPADAGRIVADLLQRDDLIDRHLSRIGSLMRFFDLRAQRPGLIPWLRRPIESREDWERVATALALYGDLGGPEADEPELLDAYRALVSYPAPMLHRLIDLLFHLPAGIDPKPVETLIERRLAALRPAVDRQEDDALIAHYALQDLRDDRLASVLKAKAAQTDIFDAKDARRRQQQSAMRYLRLVRNPYLDLPAWGAMLLQRDCSDGDPAELADSLADGLDIIISRIKKREPLSEKDAGDAGKYLTRCARALGFYGGAPTPEQSEYLDRYRRPRQVDLLHWDTGAGGQPAVATT